MNPSFERYVGIDYSGAKTPTSSLNGLRVYEADRLTAPQEVEPPPGPRKYWTRRGIAEWLVERLSEGPPILVGIDHGFSFPLQYFKQQGLPLDLPSFLDDFQRHWPTDEDIYVDFVREGSSGNGAARSGNPRWRRLTEVRVRAKSVFHFDVQGSVAKSTHAGIPWLRYIRQHVKNGVHFWPFEAGASRPIARWSRRSTLRCGAGPSQPQDERPTSRTRLQQPNGCTGPTGTAVLKDSSARTLDRTSARRPRLRDGFWEWREQP